MRETTRVILDVWSCITWYHDYSRIGKSCYLHCRHYMHYLYIIHHYIILSHVIASLFLLLFRAHPSGCAVITGTGYQSRVAIGCLNELYTDFMGKFARDTKSAASNSLSKKSKSILKKVSEKYEDPSKVDKTAKVLGQVDAVKGQMQSNIATMLKNTEKAESLNEKSNQLNEQASVFKKRSTDLKKQMRWKNLKMTLLLAAIVIAIACAIIIPLVNKAKSVTGNGGN